MKKILFTLLALVLAIGLAIPMAAPAVAHTESDPQVQTLYAGQNIDVGTVKVWNDEDTLCVKYELSEEALADGWLIFETHLAVEKELAEIPINRSGNPVPGHFQYGDTFAEGVPSWQQCIDLVEAGFSAGDRLHIAAHAVVQKTDTFNECLVSGAGTDNVLYLDEDTSNPGYPLGYTEPYQPYTGTPIPSVLAWTHSAWAPYGVSGAEWISSSYETENTDYNTWRLFTRSFTLPTNATNISGTLTMNCDNAEEVYLNGYFVGDGGYGSIVYGSSVKDVSPPPGDAHGWNHVDGPWDVSSELIAGNNELWTMTRNYAWSGGPTANPTGLIYKLCYSYGVMTTETAWADGDRFVTKGNWATYFDYQVQCTLLGDWELEYWFSDDGFAAGHNMSISLQSSDGSFSGTGYSVTGPSWTWNVSGTLTDDTVSMTIIYDQPVGGTYPYRVSLDGTVSDCDSMSGTAMDNKGHSFDWNATRA